MKKVATALLITLCAHFASAGTSMKPPIRGTLVPLDDTAAPDFFNAGRSLHILPGPRPGAMVFDEKAYGLIALGDADLRLYDIERWERWATPQQREPYVVLHVIKPWNSAVARAYPRAALVPAAWTNLPWEVREFEELSKADIQGATRSQPKGQRVVLPTRVHQEASNELGVEVSFERIPMHGATLPAVNRILSARSLMGNAQPSGFATADFTQRELITFAAGEMGSTGYEIKVQKILRTDALELHLLLIRPSPMQSTGAAMTYPGCAVWIAKKDLAGPWRIYLNGVLWDVPINSVE